MNNQDKAREKLERAKGILEGDLGRGKVYRIGTFGVLSEQDRRFLMNLDDALNLVHGEISEALALTESEQGEPVVWASFYEGKVMKRDVAGGPAVWWNEASAESSSPSRTAVPLYTGRPILGTESENGENDG